MQASSKLVLWLFVAAGVTHLVPDGTFSGPQADALLAVMLRHARE